MKRKIYISTFIIFCILISFGTYTKLAPSSSKEPANSKSLVIVDIYDTNNPEKVISLRPQLDGSLISEYSKLLADQVPNKEILGANFRVTVFYSDGSGTYYDIISTQTELITLCNRTVNSSLAKQL